MVTGARKYTKKERMIVARRVAELYRAGHSYTEIVDTLKEEGVTSPNGGPVARGSLHRLIQLGGGNPKTVPALRRPRKKGTKRRSTQDEVEERPYRPVRVQPVVDSLRTQIQKILTIPCDAETKVKVIEALVLDI